mmetsp:Transcript_38726/g.51030  ORF Transcript_38726/g.51030 Transcript_38726/m.51030 type:complete len:205 (+) Transcript_38726:56-670(+)
MDNNSVEDLMSEFSTLLGKIKRPPIAPWPDFFGRFGLPEQATLVQRLNANYEAFKVNYLMIIVSIVIFAILLHPLLLLQTLFCIGLFVYAFATRAKPLRLGSSLVLAMKEKLAAVTVVSLLLLSLTGSITRVFWTVFFASIVCLVHASFRASSSGSGDSKKYDSTFSMADVEGGSAPPAVVKGGIQEENTSRLRKKSGLTTSTS